MRNRFRAWSAGFFLLSLVPVGLSASGVAEPGPLVDRIKAVGREGEGNARAAGAWRELVWLGPGALPAILEGMDDAGPAASNWLRAAVDAIAEREVEAGHPLPAARLETFVRQTRHAGPARRLAYEWLVRVDPSAPARLLPGMLQDPSPELRRDAVARVLREAKGLLDRGDRAGATAAYRKAFTGALERDQVDLIVRQLKSLGVTVDPATHLGFIRQWQLVGPFDSTAGAGFRKAFPPEEKVDLAATYRGKGGTEVRWHLFTTQDPYGVVDLNRAVGKHNGAAAYAFAVVDSPVDRPVQIRAGSNNGLKIFLNGRLIFSREEYHHGMRMDQHVGRGTLRAGRNEILVKVCQNEQKEEWAQNWSFQLRVCDQSGSPVPLTVLPEKPVEGRLK